MKTTLSRIALVGVVTLLANSAGRSQPSEILPPLDALWSDLAGADTAKAYQAIWKLAVNPERSVPFLKTKLKPALASARGISKLVEDLDSQKFAARDKAQAELERLADGAAPALERSLKEVSSLEAKRRIEHILKRIPNPAAIPAFVQHARGLEALELAGTPDAVKVLQELSQGFASARITQMAQQAHARLVARHRLLPVKRPLLRFDADGTPLPPGTLARLGTMRLQNGDLAVLTPDGKTLVTANANLLQAWDTTTGRSLPGYPQTKAWSHLRGLAISPDGKLLAVAHLEGNLIDICLFPSGTLLHRNCLTSEFVLAWGRSTVFSSDSKEFLIATNATMHVWNMATGKKVREFKHSRRRAMTMLSSDGKWLATCDERDGVVRIWDIADGKLLRATEPQNGLGYHAVFSNDGTMFATTAPGPSIRIWHTASGRLTREIPIVGDTVKGDPHPSFAFRPDDSVLALTTCVHKGNSEQRLQLWNLRNENEKPRVLDPPPGIGWLEGFSRDGKTLLWRNGNSFASNGNSFRLLDARTGKDRHTWPYRGIMSSITYSADQKVIAAGAGDGTVTIWDRASSKLLRTMTRHRYAVRHIAFSPNGELLVSCTNLEPAVLWRVATGDRITQFDNPTAHNPWAGFTRDSRNVIVRGGFRKLRFFDAVSGSLARELSYSDEGNWSVSVSPDHRYVAAGHTSAVVTNTSSGKAMSKLTIKGQMIASAFSPDGRNLAALIQGDDVIVWDMLTGKERVRLPGPKKYFSYGRIVFSPDCRLLAWASNLFLHEPDTNRQNNLCVWDLATGKQLGPFASHRNSVTSVAFSPDGRELATASADGTVLIHPLAAK